jgi:hypothetical protein
MQRKKWMEFDQQLARAKQNPIPIKTRERTCFYFPNQTVAGLALAGIPLPTGTGLASLPNHPTTTFFSSFAVFSYKLKSTRILIQDIMESN